MKKFASLALAAAMVFSLAACGTTPNENKDDDGLTFGWSVYDLSNPFFIPMDQGVQAKCAELGVTLLPTHDEKGDATEMITGVTALINQGIDALVISPYSPESMSSVMALADDAGIPVIVVDIGTGGANVDAFIRSDMYGGGKLAGQYFLDTAAESTASKNVAIIKCETSATYAITRGEGFKDVVTEKDFTVVDEQHGDSSKDKAYSIMVDYLAKYGQDLAAVFCENDQMALGAAAAIDEAGFTGKIPVYGFDGNDDALAAIAEGKMSGTVAQDPYGMGSLGVELAYKAASGETLQGDEVDADGNQTFLAPVKMIGSDGKEVSFN
ncbi:MAG: substrate-binding domain-containing protein [Lachnospiraceae bacterium]|nr:substrate-binding domain-containing protein [Lachnospiraceae bacterium]